MNKTSSDETKRLREAEKRKKEKQNAEHLRHYNENRENINRKRREKRAQAKRLKTSQQEVPDSSTALGSSSKPKKYDWALYKRNERPRAKEAMKKKEEKAKRKRSEAEVSGTAFPTRMSKKRRVDRVKAHLPESPAKKVAVVAALIESPTTKKGLLSKGIISSAEKSDEAEVALSAMRDTREAIHGQKCRTVWLPSIWRLNIRLEWEIIKICILDKLRSRNPKCAYPKHH